MEPLDLRIAAPRGPRAHIAGIAFTARVIDKLRASLPDGELNGYFPFIGFSELWAHYTGIDLHEMQGVVERAGSEAEIETWIAERTAHVDKAQINAKMERFDSVRMSDEMREIFERSYPSDLRERHTVLFDLFDADDARTYVR
ncbi:MAG: hypothetical protein QOF71_2239 [Candidatus Eremiobacteraeota bacterium]|nr:hypothetical protein [Candidatus Eremiobacteraeota bacterium]